MDHSSDELSNESSNGSSDESSVMCSVDDGGESEVQELLVSGDMGMLAVGLSGLIILSNVFYAALYDINQALNQNMC